MDFRKRIAEQALISFGALATNLALEGYDLAANMSIWVVEHPEPYKGLVKAFLRAGCDIIGAATDNANRPLLKPYDREDKSYEYTLVLSRLAKEIVPSGCYVCGMLTATGHLLQPLGDVSYEEVYESYRVQALAMSEAQVDFVWVLTMSDIKETEAAIKAVRENTPLPVVATMTFGATPKGFRTFMGVDPKTAAQGLEKAGADVIGVNCGKLSMAETTQVLLAMREASPKPLAAKPNAGVPDIIHGQTIYPTSPEEMAREAPKLIEAGARIVGGCCGTTPEHIKRIAQVLGRSSLR